LFQEFTCSSLVKDLLFFPRKILLLEENTF
jgi:hypothetical protein